MKKILVLLLVITTTVSVLSSCSLFNKGEDHKHSFASKWSYSETQHWRAATCEHTEEKNNLGDHLDSDNNKRCDTCDYEIGSAGNNGDSGNTGDSGNIEDNGFWTQDTSSADGDLIWSPDITLTVVAEAEDNATGKLGYNFYSNWGRLPNVIAPDKVSGANQIIIGDLGYEISNEAYNLLYRYADIYVLEENGESAYIIYADGGSLAIAYTDVYSYNAAIDYIIDNLHDRSFYASGVVTSKIFGITDFIAERRNAEREKSFVELEKTLGKEATDRLRTIFDLYDEDLYIWLANLYDPEIYYKDKYYGGGFYYSVSARNYEGYLPDLESTAQAIAIIDNSGLGAAFGDVGHWGADKGYWGRSIADRQIYSHEFLPAEMWEQMYTFATTLKAADGYFYHPQWPSVSGTRKGRDAGWGNGIIAMYAKSTAASSGATAAAYFYAAPSSSSLTGRLGMGSVATAVSKVVPTAVAKELQSQEAWYAYLDSGFASGSYSICHNLNSRTTEIRNAGLWDATLTYLETHQKSNGLWEDEITYDSVSGLMKVSSFWTQSRPFPNAKAALDSAMEIINRDDDEALNAIVYVYNPWVAMDNLMGACSDEDQRTLMAYLLDNTAELFKKTYEKLGKFKKQDGGFSYTPSASAHLSQGSLVAVEGTAESDVNATGIAISSILNNMLAVYNLDSQIPELYYEYDALYFLEELDGLEAVIKEKLDVQDPIKNTFEDYDESIGEQSNGVVKYPSISSQMNLGSSQIGDDGNYKYIASEIITSPVDPGKYGNVLHVKDMVYDANGNGKIDDDGIECPDIKVGGSNTEFKMLNHALIGNTYVLEMDMYCVGSNNFFYPDVDDKGNPVTKFNSSPVMQIMFSQHGTSNHSVWVNLVPYEGEDGKIYLRINENFTGTDGVKSENIARGIPLQEWVNLRIETYKLYDDEGVLSVRAKIFVNNALVAETDSSHYSNGTYSDYPINSVKLAYYRTCDSEFYLDNVFVYKANTAYEKEQIDDSKIDTTVSAPSRYDFETDVTGGIYSKIFSTQGASDSRVTVDQTEVKVGGARPNGVTYGVFFSIVADPAGSAKQVLKINSQNTSSAVPGTIELDAQKESGKRVHVIEYDFYYGSNSHAADMIQLELLDAAGVKTGGAVTITRSVSKTEFKLKNATAAETLKAGQWYKIRIAIDSDAKQINFHFSDDNGQTYYVGAQPASISSSATISKIRMIINAYNNTGDVYMDNMTYTMAAEVPAAEIIVNEMAGMQNPTNKITYDFENGAIPVNDYFKATSMFGGKSYIAGTTEYNSAIAANGKSGDANLLKAIGTQYYVVNDPTDASNKVLQIVTKNGSGNTSTVDVIASKTGTVGNVLEFTFDYYFDYNNCGVNYKSSLPMMRVMFWDGQYVPEDVDAERRLSIFSDAKLAASGGATFTFDKSKPEGQETVKLDKVLKFGSESVSSHTWYRIKIIVAGGKQYTYLSSNGGDTYTQIGDAKTYSADATRMKYARLHIGAFNNCSRQYVDNITYEMKDTFIDPTK